MSISKLDAPPFPLFSRPPPHPRLFMVCNPLEWHRKAASFNDSSFIGCILMIGRASSGLDLSIDDASSSGKAHPRPSAVPEIILWA